jgi:hypothetical protein
MEDEGIEGKRWALRCGATASGRVADAFVADKSTPVLRTDGAD